MKKVAVIGAGPSGITAIKNFIDEGFDVTAFERCDGVGGNWRFNDPSGHSSVFETTHIISSKYTSFYEDYPLPDDASDYPSHKELLSYFDGYAEHFDIKKNIKFGTEVLSCKQQPNGRWLLKYKHLDGNDEIPLNLMPWSFVMGIIMSQDTRSTKESSQGIHTLT